jgi:hypothetical protein
MSFLMGLQEINSSRGIPPIGIYTLVVLTASNWSTFTPVEEL